MPFHIHRHLIVKEGKNGNAYLQCRCGSRRINQPNRNQPMDYRWIETGMFSQEPTRGWPGRAGQAKAE